MAAKQDVVMGLQLQGATSVTKGLNQVQSGLNGVENAGKKANKMFRGMRGGTAQLGYQIQDVAVQLQGGQNALLVFGQQGSQLASIMGPGGALIGALIAVGAALATTFFAATKKATEGSDELKDSIMGLIKETGKYNKEFEAFLALQNKLQLKEDTEEFDELIEKYESGQARLKLLTRQQDEYSQSLEVGSEAARKLGLNTRDVSEAIEKQNQANIVAAARLRILKNGFDDVNGVTRKSVELRLNAAQRSISASNAELDAFIADQKKQTRLGAESVQRRLKLANIRINAGHREMAELIKADKQKDELAKNEAKRLLEVMAEEDKVFKEKQRRQGNLQQVDFFLGGPADQLQMQADERLAVIAESLAAKDILEQEAAAKSKAVNDRLAQDIEMANMMQMQGTLSMFQSSVSTMGALFDQASGIGKAFYLISQTMAAAQAIISGYAASMNIVRNMTALGADPATAALMGQVAVGMGFATAGAIMGQTVAGFEGGGITFNGVRSGGMDGKGGRMAVVHPNEKITDLEKGGGMQAQPVNVTMNISAVDAKGIDKLLTDRRGLITGMVNKAINNQGRSSL